jgi:hypothetical protein
MIHHIYTTTKQIYAYILIMSLFYATSAVHKSE